MYPVFKSESMPGYSGPCIYNLLVGEQTLLSKFGSESGPGSRFYQNPIVYFLPSISEGRKRQIIKAEIIK